MFCWKKPHVSNGMATWRSFFRRPVEALAFQFPRPSPELVEAHLPDPVGAVLSARVRQAESSTWLVVNLSFSAGASFWTLVEMETKWKPKGNQKETKRKPKGNQTSISDSETNPFASNS